MLVILFGVGVIVLALAITLPTAKNAGIASIVAFVILGIAGAVGAVIFAQHYHLPVSEGDKVEHTREVIIEQLEEEGVEVKKAPEADDLEAGHAGLWTFHVPESEMSPEQTVNLLCVPGTDFPEKADMQCSAGLQMLGDGKKVDFSSLEGGH